MDITLLTASRYVNPPKIDWYVQNILNEDNLVRKALEKKVLRLPAPVGTIRILTGPKPALHYFAPPGIILIAYRNFPPGLILLKPKPT
jgi:hypothetical protein